MRQKRTGLHPRAVRHITHASASCHLANVEVEKVDPNTEGSARQNNHVGLRRREGREQLARIPKLSLHGQLRLALSHSNDRETGQMRHKSTTPARAGKKKACTAARKKKIGPLPTVYMSMYVPAHI